MRHEIIVNPGDKFGKWTVVEKSNKTDPSNNKYLICRCECGTIRAIRKYKLINGDTKSCGCSRTKDMTGQKVGMLTFIEPTGKDEHNRVIWKCKCDCGNICFRIISKAKSVGTCGMHVQETSKKILAINNKKRKLIEGTCVDSLNQHLSKNNTSGVKGVHWDKAKQKWTAQIMFKKKNFFLGRYDKKEDAIAARKEAEKELFEPIIKKYSEDKK